MKRFHRVEIALLILLAVMVVACTVLLAINPGASFDADHSRILRISLSDAALSEEAADSTGQLHRTYTFTLPADGRVGDCLALYCMDQFCSVRIDGTTRFSYEGSRPDFIRTSGNYWAIIRLGYADTGKTAEVQLTPVFASAPAPEASIGPMNRLVAVVLTSDLPLLIPGLLCAIFGLTLTVLSLFSFSDHRDKRAMLSLSGLTLSAGIWKIADLPFIMLLTHTSAVPFFQPKAIYLSGAIAFVLMPVFAIQYLIAMRRNDRFFPDSVCVIAIELTAVVLIALQITGIVELQNTIPFLMAESAVLIAVMFCLIIRQRANRWLICIPISAGADLLITLLTGSSRYAVVLMACILVSDYISGVIFVRRTIQQRSELRDARTTALLSQIRPHFIHNTLTSIYYLCDSDPQTAKRLVHDFNSHLRANFTSLSVKTPISFSEEMDNVRAYLSVEQVRFSDKLSVEYDTPHTAFRLPALTVQPLVENAVKHNVDSSKPPVHIRIRSFRKDNGSYVVIEDDGTGGSSSPEDAHSHVGLQNVADRLDILCGGTLTVTSLPEGGTVVTVFIPDAV